MRTFCAGENDMGVLGRLSMQYRITLGVALGLAVILGVFAYLAISTVDDSREAAKRERLAWAQAMAVHVDAVLRDTLERTDLIARLLGDRWGEEGFDPAALLLRYDPYLEASDVALFGADGSLLWSDLPPEGGDAAALYDEPLVSRALSSGRPLLDQCQGERLPTACVAAPVVGPGGDELGVIVRRLDLRDRGLNLLPTPQLGQAAHAEILTSDARVLAADAPSLLDTSTHAEALLDFVAQGTAGVRIHKPTEGGDQHIVAYTPLRTIPGWGIAVEQDTDVALAVAENLQRRFLIFGALALILAAGLAWFDVRQVVKPLTVLTARAERMARGDLETAIDSSRRDEVGTLARAFESMRVRLKQSLEEIERRDRELEQRVMERTQEVQRLLEELQRKEEVRSRLLEKVISAQEEERKRMARELHDELGQALTGMLMNLEAAEETLGQDAQGPRERIARARSLATHSIESIRHLIQDLRPAALDDLGLVPAIRAFAEGRLGDRGIRLTLETSGLRDRLPPLVETAVFRVVQEAVTNIVRHAEARSARIRLERSGDRISVTVEDDGRGFDPAEVLHSPDRARALGLLGMEERVSLLGGSLRVESAPGRGTRVRAEIPLEPEEESP